MAVSILIQTPGAILIVAGVLFLAFGNDKGWIMIGVGAVLVVILAVISSKRTVVVEHEQQSQK